MSLPVLFVAKGTMCPACKALNWAALEGQIKKGGFQLRLVQVEVPSINDLDLNAYPAGVKAFIQWFPTFALIPGREWDAAFALGLGPGNTYDFTKTVSLFNLALEGAVVSKDPRHAKYNMYYGGFGDWIRDTLATPAFQAIGPALAPQQQQQPPQPFPLLAAPRRKKREPVVFAMAPPASAGKAEAAPPAPQCSERKFVPRR